MTMSAESAACRAAAAVQCSHAGTLQSGALVCLVEGNEMPCMPRLGCCQDVQASGPCLAHPRFTIREGLFALMLFISRCVRYTGGKWFTAIVISQSSSEKSSGGRNTPATASWPVARLQRQQICYEVDASRWAWSKEGSNHGSEG